MYQKKLVRLAKYCQLYPIFLWSRFFTHPLEKADFNDVLKNPFGIISGFSRVLPGLSKGMADGSLHSVSHFSTGGR
jgi:hypothetical protein